MMTFPFDGIRYLCFMMLSGEKKKTKAIANELNPVWNEVSASEWKMSLGSLVIFMYLDTCLQVLEFDLKGSSLDASSSVDVIVKDYETIGKDRYVTQ